MFGSETVKPFGIGIVLNSSNPVELQRQTQTADAGGFAFVSVGDNPEHMMDTYVSLTLVAGSARRAHVGTTITTPIHRDPLVVASAFSSVATLHPERVFIGIGTGRARQKATVPELREHIVTLRQLWSTGKATYRGEELRLNWDAQPVPIVLCASGPRALRLGGELADAVIIESGLTPELVDSARNSIADGARAAGRDPADIALCWYARTTIAPTDDEAVYDSVPSMAAAGAFIARRRSGLDDVPDRYRSAMTTLAERYDMGAHFRSDAGNPNRKLLVDESLREYLVERTGLVGTPARWLDRIAELRGIGVDNILCVGAGGDKDAMIDLVGRQVIPELETRP
ncbi:5,10-methylenetetrahydromethanopterin reductase [Rhodococcus sp. 27YEA15]|uniref:LLM class flavin-dependent oxidoreductase n=1 Tax=Rhodococcus sp. 27YEA15 TaxID=3156259 RepID=UPI003C7C22EB